MNGLFDLLSEPKNRRSHYNMANNNVRGLKIKGLKKGFNKAKNYAKKNYRKIKNAYNQGKKNSK